MSVCVCVWFVSSKLGPPQRGLAMARSGLAAYGSSFPSSQRQMDGMHQNYLNAIGVWRQVPVKYKTKPNQTKPITAKSNPPMGLWSLASAVPTERDKENCEMSVLGWTVFGHDLAALVQEMVTSENREYNGKHLGSLSWKSRKAIFPMKGNPPPPNYDPWRSRCKGGAFGGLFWGGICFFGHWDYGDASKSDWPKLIEGLNGRW